MVRKALTAVDTCSQVTITDYNTRDLCYCLVVSDKHTSGHNQFLPVYGGQNLKKTKIDPKHLWCRHPPRKIENLSCH